jgi:hypothetical protein
VLRHQLTVLRRQLPRPRLEPADRALLAASSRALPRARWSCVLVKPETLLRWHRRLVAGAWTYPHRRPGRPSLDTDMERLIVRLVRENPWWGYQRIQGELLRLGVQVSATAIRTTLRHRLDPAPRPRRRTPTRTRPATGWCCCEPTACSPPRSAPDTPRPAPPGVAEVDGVVLFCADQPAPSLLLGHDQAEVLVAAALLGLDQAGHRPAP